jgi:hypothetical protein
VTFGPDSFDAFSVDRLDQGKRTFGCFGSRFWISAGHNWPADGAAGGRSTLPEERGVTIRFWRGLPTIDTEQGRRAESALGAGKS